MVGGLKIDTEEKVYFWTIPDTAYNWERPLKVMLKTIKMKIIVQRNCTIMEIFHFRTSVNSAIYLLLNINSAIHLLLTDLKIKDWLVATERCLHNRNWSGVKYTYVLESRNNCDQILCHFKYLEGIILLTKRKLFIMFYFINIFSYIKP